MDGSRGVNLDPSILCKSIQFLLPHIKESLKHQPVSAELACGCKRLWWTCGYSCWNPMQQVATMGSTFHRSTVCIYWLWLNLARGERTNQLFALCYGENPIHFITSLFHHIEWNVICALVSENSERLSLLVFFFLTSADAYSDLHRFQQCDLVQHCCTCDMHEELLP